MRLLHDVWSKQEGWKIKTGSTCSSWHQGDKIKAFGHEQIASDQVSKVRLPKDVQLGHVQRYTDITNGDLIHEQRHTGLKYLLEAPEEEQPRMEV